MTPQQLVLVVSYYGLCLVQGQEVVNIKHPQESVVRKDVDIHLLCEARPYFQSVLFSDYTRPHKVLSWCMNWDQYAECLAEACLRYRHILVVVPNITWNSILHETAGLYKDICPHVKWLHLEEIIAKNSTKKTNNHTLKPITADDGPFSTEMFPGGARSWTLLSGKKVRMGCVVYNKAGATNSCVSHEGKAFVHALGALNVSAEIKPVGRGAFAEALRGNKADIVVITVGLTQDRYQHFDFTVNKFGEAVYHVQKKWRHHAHFFLGVLPWSFLLALSTLVSVASFALLNLCQGKRPTSDLGGVVLALIATTLSFASPLDGDHARSSSGRVIMAFWMLACFSLATYTRSLLTASLMAKPTWEADDTFEEMLPKLRQGRLLPCAEKNSFFHVLLMRAPGNSSDVVDVMALAARRWGHGRRDFTGSFESCLERARRGTHVLFSEGIDFCSFSRFENTIVGGEKPIRSLIGGFPISRAYSLRAELILLAHRIFETGWDIRMSRSLTWNCSGIIEKDEASFGATHLLYFYGAFCTVSFLALVLEIVHKRLFGNRQNMKSSLWGAPTGASYGRVSVRISHRTRRIGRRIIRRVGTLERIGGHAIITTIYTAPQETAEQWQRARVAT